MRSIFDQINFFLGLVAFFNTKFAYDLTDFISGLLAQNGHAITPV